MTWMTFRNVGSETQDVPKPRRTLPTEWPPEPETDDRDTRSISSYIALPRHSTFRAWFYTNIFTFLPNKIIKRYV